VRRRQELDSSLRAAETSEDLEGAEEEAEDIHDRFRAGAAEEAPPALAPPPGPGPRTPARRARVLTRAEADPPALLELEGLLGDYLDTSVTVTLSQSRGRLVIDFADLQDLERIYGLIAGGGATDQAP
jgi:hypothetical protein